MHFGELALRTVFKSFLAVILFAGCGSSGPQGGSRVVTIAINGTVHVDGVPAAFLRVVAVPMASTPSVPIESSALTAQDGTFSLSTYESGDGVPPGSYKLTFIWGEINLMNGQYSGDKFNGKYADPTTSELSLTVADSDAPHDLGVIELTTGPAKK